MLKTILCATDGSDHAERAVDWASDLASRYGAALVLLYVVPHREAPPELRHLAEVEHLIEPETRTKRAVTDPLFPGGPSASALTQSEVTSRTIYQEIGQRVVDAARRTAMAAGVKDVKALVEDGEPAHQIIEAAKRHAADLIVMGRRGLGDLKGLLLGSVSHKVGQLADCACLTVK